MKGFTENEKELLRLCVIAQIENNERAKVLVSSYSICGIIDGQNKELADLLEKIKNL